MPGKYKINAILTDSLGEEIINSFNVEIMNEEAFMKLNPKTKNKISKYQA